MRRILFCFGLAATFAFPASAKTLTVPDGAEIRVGSFTFPHALYNGAEEEAQRQADAFRHQLVSALKQAGLNASLSDKPTGRTVEATDADASEATDAASENEVARADETGVEEAASPESTLDSGAEHAEEKAASTQGDEADDELMAVVRKAEAEEKGREASSKEPAVNSGKNKNNPTGTTTYFLITGSAKNYTEEVGMPVSTGKNRRSSAKVALDCIFQVRNPAGKVMSLGEVTAAASRNVPETEDIYLVLMSLSEKTFLEAGYKIAEKITGKKRVVYEEDAEPGSAEDEYADSPGKRLRTERRRR